MPKRSKKVYRLGILTAAWGRSKLTRDVLLHYAGLRVPRMEIVPVCVWSAEDPDPPPFMDRWNYVEAPNAPLGRKWNVGLQDLGSRAVDAVMIIGSDDFVSYSYFDLVREQLEKGAGVISCRDAFIYLPPSDVVAYCESIVPGPGRVVTRKVIEALNGKLWDDDINTHLDSSIVSRLRQIDHNPHNARNMGERGFAVLDVKTAEGPNMWSFVRDESNNYSYLEDADGRRLRIRRVTYISARQFFKDHFPQLSNYTALGSGDSYV